MLLFLKHPLIRWGSALAWTGLVCGLMLIPSKGTVVKDTSAFFGGTDWTDAIGHGVLFGVLALLWAYALKLHVASLRAWRMAIILALTLGFATELAQVLIPSRGAALLDLFANGLGVIAAFKAYGVYQVISHEKHSI